MKIMWNHWPHIILPYLRMRTIFCNRSNIKVLIACITDNTTLVFCTIITFNSMYNARVDSYNAQKIRHGTLIVLINIKFCYHLIQDIIVVLFTLKLVLITRIFLWHSSYPRSYYIPYILKSWKQFVCQFLLLSLLSNTNTLE